MLSKDFILFYLLLNKMSKMHAVINLKGCFNTIVDHIFYVYLSNGQCTVQSESAKYVNASE